MTIDVHCHLLPGLDDGPSTMVDSLALACIAVANGITHAVTTPHIQPGRFDNTRSSIQQALEQFRFALQEADIPLQIGMAAEVRVSAEIFQLLEDDEIPFMGEYEGSRVLLLEFPHNQIIPGTENLVKYLIKQGIRPMIAHPERNRDVLRNLKLIEPYVEMGCLLQLTAASVAGQFGGPAMKRANEMLKRGWVSVLASDAHNEAYRPPELEPGRQAAEKIVGESASWAMVRETPQLITRQQFID